jgi:hypothetical protein
VDPYENVPDPWPRIERLDDPSGLDRNTIRYRVTQEMPMPSPEVVRAAMRRLAETIPDPPRPEDATPVVWGGREIGWLEQDDDHGRVTFHITDPDYRRALFPDMSFSIGQGLHGTEARVVPPWDYEPPREPEPVRDEPQRWDVTSAAARRYPVPRVTLPRT